MSYPIQRDFLESLEAIFLTQARSLLTEIAQDLGKPVKPLLKAFEAHQVKLHVAERYNETSEANHECKALVFTSELAKRCREPVYQGSSYCPYHLRFTATEEPEGKRMLDRIRTEDGDVFFLDSKTQEVFTSEYQCCGRHKDGKYKVFKVEDQVEE